MAGCHRSVCSNDVASRTASSSKIQETVEKFWCGKQELSDVEVNTAVTVNIVVLRSVTLCSLV
jgi:hypothetical protein